MCATNGTNNHNPYINQIMPCYKKMSTIRLFWESHKGSRQNVNFFQKGGGVDPKVYIFKILNFGKFQVSKWASGMKTLFKVSFKN